MNEQPLGVSVNVGKVNDLDEPTTTSKTESGEVASITDVHDSLMTIVKEYLVCNVPSRQAVVEIGYHSRL